MPGFILDFLDRIAKGSGFVDFGCGSGRCLSVAVQLGIRSIGVDLSSQSLQNVRNAQIGSSLVQADIESLPFRSNSIERGISNGVIHHCPNPDRALMELARTMKPGGTVALALYKKHHYHRYLYQTAGRIFISLDRQDWTRTLLFPFRVFFFLIYALRFPGLIAWRNSKSQFYDYFISPIKFFYAKKEIIQLLGSCGFSAVEYYQDRGALHHFLIRKQPSGGRSQ